MARQASVGNKNGYWYSEAGGKSRYFGRVDLVSRTQAMALLWRALADAGVNRRERDFIPVVVTESPTKAGRITIPGSKTLPLLSPLTVTALTTMFLAWVRDHRGVKAHAERSRHLSRFRDGVGDLDAVKVQGSHLEGFQSALRGDGHADEYIKKHADTVRMMYNKGTRFGWLPSGFKPFASVEPIRRTPKTLAESELLTDSEIQALFRSADADMNDMLRVYHATGARTAELFTARVSDFQPKTRQIVLGKHKRTHTLRIPVARAIALNDHAYEIVRRRCENRNARDLIFPNADGGEFTNMTIAKRFRTVRRNARIRDTITIYSFRHVWISESLMAGLDALLVAKMSGTSVTMIERTYGHWRCQSFADAQAKLDAARASQK